MEENVTVGIATWNSSLSLTAVLEALSLQEIPALETIVYDNGSVDGTPQMVEEQIKNRYWSWLQLRAFKTSHVAGDREINIPFMRSLIVKECNTPLIFFLDHDVLIPPHSLQELVHDFLEQEKNSVGMLGMCYEPLHGHVTMGATLMRTEVAKKIQWQMDSLCDCQNTIKQLAGMGLQAKYSEGLTARHLKLNTV